jgi:hypothetical protein
MKSVHILVRKEPYYRREALESGFKRIGFTHVRAGQPATGNVLVVWGRKPQDEPMCAAYERAGGTVVVMENGYLQRVDKSMYALSVGQHHSGGPVGAEDRFSKLGFEVKPWRHTPGGRVVVCAQRGIGSASMASPPLWAENFAKKIKGAYVRNHPGNHPPKVPLTADLVGAACCAVWSSNAGVLALVEGYPVVYAAPHWICEAGGTRGWNNPGYGDASRVAALHRMSWSQWHHEEIKTGEPLARLLGV